MAAIIPVKIGCRYFSSSYDAPARCRHMNMNKKPLNPQLKTAIYIAPFLFIGGFIAMELFSKREQTDETLFQLQVVNERCDFSNNDCRFGNGDLKLSVSLEERFDDGNSMLRVTAEENLKGVAISLSDIDDDAVPATMVSSGDPRQWELGIRAPLTIFPYLRLVVSTGKGLYYGEAPVEK